MSKHAPILALDPDYRNRVVATRFAKDYKIKWTSPSRAVLEPLKQPSKLQATVFPMYKTRFKYEIVFDSKEGTVAHEDLLKITFNRSNGSTPEQQGRIFRDRQEFEERVKQLQAQIDHDQYLANMKAAEPSPAA